MRVTIDMCAGAVSYRLNPTKKDINKNIVAIDRAIHRKLLVCDMNYLVNTKTILEGIREQLPD